MRKASVKPSLYPLLPFHLIRAVSLLSTLIVGIILAVFIYHLHQKSYKLPWAFLVLIVAVVLSLLNYALTTIIHCCCGLSPRLNLTTNTILLLLWLASLGVLSWSMAHTILTTCSTSYWGNSTGIAVCRIYKTFFAFTATATASFIASIALDVIVRKRQTRLGKYDPMASDAAFALGTDVKLEDQRSFGHGSTPSDMSGGVNHNYSDLDRDSPPSVTGSYRDIVPGNPYSNSYGRMNNLEQFHAGEAQDYSDAAPARGAWGVPRVRLSAYDRSGYAQPPEQVATHYDPGAYR